MPAISLAQEWTGFRGTQGNGVSAAEGFPGSFDDKSLAWRTTLPGAGVSSPVVWGGKVFLTSETEVAGERLVMAVDAVSGRELWRVMVAFRPEGKHQFNSFASSTPCVDGERIYLAWTSGGKMLAQAHSHDGKSLWSRDLGVYAEDHGSGASPVLGGKVLVICKDNVGGDSFICGLAVEDGAVLWKHARTSVRTPFSTPLVFQQRDGTAAVLVAGNPAALTCLRVSDGKLLWEVLNATPTDRPVASPTLAGDVCFMSMGQGGAGKAMVAVRVTDAVPSILWQNTKGLPYVPTPVGVDNRFYVLGDGGVLTCLRAADGTEVYQERVFLDKAYSSPVLVGGRIYCIGRSGKVAVIAAGDTFKKLGEGQLGEDMDATPAIAEGRMFFRTKTHLLCLPAAAEPAQ